MRSTKNEAQLRQPISGGRQGFGDLPVFDASVSEYFSIHMKKVCQNFSGRQAVLTQVPVTQINGHH